jgi:hypothetical protein
MNPCSPCRLGPWAIGTVATARNSVAGGTPALPGLRKSTPFVVTRRTALYLGFRSGLTV